MEIRRLHANLNDFNDGVFEISGDEFNYAVKVLRQKQGFSVIVNVGDGYDYLGVITEIKKDRLCVKVSEKVENPATPKNKITLYQGSCKLGKNDFIVQKAVELGVDKFVPFVSRNCAETKFASDRANKIALESAKQCGSAYLTEVENVISFDDMLKRFSTFDNVLFAYEYEKKNRIKDCDLSGKNIALVVGAEGGFTEEEAQEAKDNRAQIVTLGKRILRAETASIVSCALLLDRLGELDYD